MSKEIIETKICKICGKEKPANEFNSKGKGFYDTKCKVCNWFSKRNFDYNKTKWTHKEDRVIIDSLFNKKLSLNEISKILNIILS